MQNPMPGDDRPTDDLPNPLLVDLLAAFLGLSDDTENAGHILILGPTGKFIGDMQLSPKDVQIATQALTAARALTEATKGMNLPGDTPIDPALENELEEHCIGLDADHLMDLAAQDPNSAVAAFDEIVRYADYEQIMREDGES